jgi:N-acetylmuramoyl-L-alanine amidase
VRKITKHIIHCSDSPTGDVTEIRKWHLARGWNDVGYHYIIRRDGEIEVGRTLDVIGAHCEGQNSISVGTCLVGRDVFTAKQFESLRRIHTMLQALFPGIGPHPHNEFANKRCPCFDVYAVLRCEPAKSD